MSKKPVMVPTSQQIFRDIETHGFWLTKWVHEHSKVDRAKMINALLPLARAGKLNVASETFKLTDYAAALERYNTPQKGVKVFFLFE